MKNISRILGIALALVLACSVLTACQKGIKYSGATLLAAKVGDPYSQSVAAAEISGDGAIKYELKEGSMLPIGLVISQDGDITGVPRNKNAAATTFTVVASAEGYKPAEAVFTIPSIAEGTLKFDTVTLPPAAHNKPYAAQITAAGAATSTGTAYAKTGDLPTGLTFNTANGNITGTPTVMGEEKTFSVTASAADCASATADFTIKVVEPWLEYGSGSVITLEDAFVTQFYNVNLATATGKDGIITYTLKAGSAFPAGLDWDAQQPGILSGYPATQITRHEFTVIASAAGYTPAEATFRMTVRPEPNITSDGVITYNAKPIPAVYVNEPFSLAAAVGGGSANNRATVSYALESGATVPGDLQILPNGTLRSLTGLPAVGTFTFNVVANATRCEPVTASFTLTVELPQLLFVGGWIEQGLVGAAYSESIPKATAPGGATPVIIYTLRASGSGSTMPAGLVFNNGLVSGIPTKSTKSWRFAVTASADGFTSKEVDMYIRIRDAVESGITRFEGEYIDFTGLTGGGYSGSAIGTQMIQRDTGGWGASNGHFIGYTHGVEGGYLTFRITSSAAVSGLSFIICLASEITNTVTLNPGNFNIRINNVSVPYSIVLPGAGAEESGFSSFTPYTIATNAQLKAGENVIELEVVASNGLLPNREGGPAIDYIEFGNLGGRTVLSWQPYKCNY